MVPKYIHSRVKTVGESSSASPTSTTSASSATARVPQVSSIRSVARLVILCKFLTLFVVSR